MALQNAAIFERCRPVRPLRFDDLCTVGCDCAASTPAAGAKAKLGDRALAVVPAAVAPAPEAHPTTSCSLPDELRLWNPSPKLCQRTAACGRRGARGKCCRRCGRACAAPGAGMLRCGCSAICSHSHTYSSTSRRRPCTSKSCRLWSGSAPTGAAALSRGVLSLYTGNSPANIRAETDNVDGSRGEGGESTKF